jgi:flagellar protein FliS
MSVNKYDEQASISDDPYILILKLYEGLIKFLSLADEAMEKGDIKQKFFYINKSIAIFDELRNILDYDGGDIAHYLDGLYLYQIQSLFKSGVKNDREKLKQVSKVALGLLDAWRHETKL